jgi:hypothetical protein
MRGHIKNGTAVLDEPVKLPNGTSVKVDVRAVTEPPEVGLTWGEVFGDLAGSVQGMLADVAENHDHYIHGTAKGIDTRGGELLPPAADRLEQTEAVGDKEREREGDESRHPPQAAGVRVETQAPAGSALA